MGNNTYIKKYISWIISHEPAIFLYPFCYCRGMASAYDEGGHLANSAGFDTFYERYALRLGIADSLDKFYGRDLVIAGLGREPVPEADLENRLSSGERIVVMDRDLEKTFAVIEQEKGEYHMREPAPNKEKPPKTTQTSYLF
ncbi:MAG: hypothetical protein R6U32_03965 [Candidatus Woesearchaeota archaeon]